MSGPDVSEQFCPAPDGAVPDLSDLPDLTEPPADLEPMVDVAEVEAILDDDVLAARLWRRGLSDHVSGAVVETDSTGAIRWVNAAAKELLLTDGHEHRQLLDYISDSDSDEFARLVDEIHQHPRGRFLRLVGTTAPETWFKVRGREIASDAEQPPGVIWVILPIPAEAEPDTVRTAARIVSRLTSLPQRAGSLREFMQEAARLCDEMAAPGTAVSITLGEPSSPEVVASNSKLAQQVDRLQIQFSEGPCQSAWESGTLIVSDAVGADRRWDRFGPAAVGLGVQSVVSSVIRVDGDAYGVLNVYGEAVNTFEESTVALIRVMTDTLAAVIQSMNETQGLRELVSQLNEAMASRAVIEQAKGILMSRHGCTADDAFALLVRASQDHNVKLRKVAADVVRQTEFRAGRSDYGV